VIVGPWTTNRQTEHDPRPDSWGNTDLEIESSSRGLFRPLGSTHHSEHIKSFTTRRRWHACICGLHYDPFSDSMDIHVTQDAVVAAPLNSSASGLLLCAVGREPRAFWYAPGDQSGALPWLTPIGTGDGFAD
jgi:hypothetical protein